MIYEIEITNFKSIRHSRLKLEPINVLIGANGVGKSNLISFFKLLRSLNNNQLNIYVAEQGYMDNLMYFGSKDFEEVSGKITFSNIGGDTTNRYVCKLLADNRNRAFISFESTDYNKGNNANPNWSVFYYAPNNERSYVLNEKPNIRDGYLKEYFDDFRVYHFHDTSPNSPLKKTARLNDNAFLREDGENLPSFLYYLQEKHPKVLYRIEKIINSIAPFFEKFNLQPDRINEEYIQLEWKEVGFDRYQNAQNLSDGTLRFIALTTLMLQPKPPKTIIIDEPELGLHPSAINKLAGIIKKVSANSQVIISTQSINLVNNFEPEDIITVDREDNQSVFRRLDPEKLQVWLDDYGLGEIWYKSVIGGQP